MHLVHGSAFVESSTVAVKGRLWIHEFGIRPRKRAESNPNVIARGHGCFTGNLQKRKD